MVSLYRGAGETLAKWSNAIFFHVLLTAAVSGFWLLVCIVVVMIFTLNATKTLNMTKTLDDGQCFSQELRSGSLKIDSERSESIPK